MIAAPVVIAADRLMPVRSIVQRYATVYGVGWDFEVVEHVAWNVEDALKFANFRGGGIDKFREITDVVYEVSMPPLPTPAPMSNWSKAADPVSVMERDVEVMGNGITTVSSFSKIREWRSSLRPDLDGTWGHKWAQEQIAAKRKFGIIS